MMRSRSTIERALAKLKRDGISRAAYDLGLRALNSVVVFKVLRGLVVSKPKPEFVECPAGFNARFLSPALLRNFARDPCNELSEGFVAEALSKGDECFAICDGDALAAYGWYSTRPTRIDPPDLLLRARGDYVYTYKGFTHARYRGQRLHAFGITQALQAYLARGFNGLVSYVESTNFNSLKSCARIGFETFGSIYVGRLFGHYIKRTSGGCTEFEFGLESVPFGEDEEPSPADCSSIA